MKMSTDSKLGDLEEWLVVKVLIFQSRGCVFKTTEWLEGQCSLSSLGGEYLETY